MHLIFILATFVAQAAEKTSNIYLHAYSSSETLEKTGRYIMLPNLKIATKMQTILEIPKRTFKTIPLIPGPQGPTSAV